MYKVTFLSATGIKHTLECGDAVKLGYAILSAQCNNCCKLKMRDCLIEQVEFFQDAETSLNLKDIFKASGVAV